MKHVHTCHHCAQLAQSSGHSDHSRMHVDGPGNCLLCSSMVAHCRLGKQGRGSERRRLCAGRHPERLTKLEAFLSGGLARAVAAAATCPFTVVKTRMEFTGSGQPVQVGRAGTQSSSAPLGVLQHACSEKLLLLLAQTVSAMPTPLRCLSGDDDQARHCLPGDGNRPWLAAPVLRHVM